MDHRAALRAAVDAALANVDALILPTLPIPPPLIGASTIKVRGSDLAVRPLTLKETQLFNLSGHPAIALPCGQTSEGLPVSMQFVAAETNALLSIALACEHLLDQHQP